MQDKSPGKFVECECQDCRGLKRRYAMLTVGMFAPLIWSFLTVTNFFPIVSWSLFSARADLSAGTTYYILRGETEGGQDIDVPPIEITDGLTGRIWMMVPYVVANESFHIASPHPKNVALTVGAGGVDRLPPAVRMSELLLSWGQSYNLRFPPGSAHRLRALRLDAYRWPGGQYANYDQYLHSWRVEL